MTKIEIYISPFCGFCSRAKSLLDMKGVQYEEIDITVRPDKRREMIKRTGHTSVPQIFVEGVHIGDCAAVYEFEAKGELNAKLGIG